MKSVGALFDRIEEGAAAIRAVSALRPHIGIVLGSGLGALADEMDAIAVIPYDQIPHFAISTAPGHAGKLVLGYLEDQPVVLMAGRAHLYEGYTAEQVTFPIRVMHRLGADMLLITNAAGGVNISFQPGAFMLITDHINLTGQNPLVGPSDARLGPRFPDMTEVYSFRLRALAQGVATEMGLSLLEGVYLGLMGPSYETPAEIRMARIVGADAVGMSTVMEAVVAAHCGMEILGISCITNMAAGILPQKLSEEEVIETAFRVRAEFAALLRSVVRAVGEQF